MCVCAWRVCMACVRHTYYITECARGMSEMQAVVYRIYDYMCSEFRIYFYVCYVVDTCTSAHTGTVIWYKLCLVRKVKPRACARLRE